MKKVFVLVLLVVAAWTLPSAHAQFTLSRTRLAQITTAIASDSSGLASRRILALRNNQVHHHSLRSLLGRIRRAHSDIPTADHIAQWEPFLAALPTSALVGMTASTEDIRNVSEFALLSGDSHLLHKLQQSGNARILESAGLLSHYNTRTSSGIMRQLERHRPRFELFRSAFILTDADFFLTQIVLNELLTPAWLVDLKHVPYYQVNEVMRKLPGPLQDKYSMFLKDRRSSLRLATTHRLSSGFRKEELLRALPEPMLDYIRTLIISDANVKVDFPIDEMILDVKTMEGALLKSLDAGEEDPLELFQIYVHHFDHVSAKMRAEGNLLKKTRDRFLKGALFLIEHAAAMESETLMAYEVTAPLRRLTEYVKTFSKKSNAS